MTTPKVLTEADAAADLAGVPRPNDLPSVGTEDAPPVNFQKRVLNRMLNDFALACMYGDDLSKRMATSKVIHDHVDALVSERDELASRVTKLTKALTEARRWIGDGECSDGLPREYWTGDHTAVVDLVDAALNASKE